MKIIKILLYVALVIGLSGFLLASTCLIFANMGLRINTTKIEMPIGQTPAGGNRYLTIDSKGNIYVFTSTYSRIQKYNSEGSFLRGWFVKCAFPEVVLDKKENIHLLTKNNSHLVFDSNGIPQDLDANSSIDKRTELKTDKILGNDGFEYKLLTGLLKSKVVKYNKNSVPEIVVREPWYFLLRWPSPGGEMMFFSGLLLFLINKVKK